MSGKLRIAFYTDSYLPAYDGVVTSITNLRSELIRRGHRVFVFTSGGAAAKEATAGDGDVYIVRSVKFKKYPQYNIALLPFTTATKLLDVRPDIIHAQTPFVMGSAGLMIGKLSKIPVVGTFHTLFTNRQVIESYASKLASRRISRYAWKYARFFYNNCDAVIAPSPSTSSLLTGRGIKNVSVVPNGIDTKRYSPKVDGGALRRRLQRNRNERIVLCLGRVSAEKRLETLLRAAALLKGENIRIVIAGTGPAAAHYGHMAARLGVSEMITFTGFVPDKDLPKYYAAADIFCTPSTFETQGLAALEAMATGKPVVGAASLAIGDIINDGKNGERFKPGDGEDCARKIKKAINNIRSYKETVRTAENYSIERATDEALLVYYKVLKGAMK